MTKTPERYPRRLPTRTVYVGDVPLGGAHPIRIQSMTVSTPEQVHQTVREIEALAHAGCELVRVTVPQRRAAECLKDVKAELNRRHCRVPLIADVHFAPSAAYIAARYVEKVRINPGNFQDRKTLQGPQREWTDQEWNEAIARIADRLRPLLQICREYGTALRIGVNHGSLSDRILWRWGDTPEGMVESAWEFIRICQEENFHQVVLSMKASNPLVMIDAYRLLVLRMKQEGTLYPLHIGVTEAGNQLEGRIKSAIGIGTLLAEGIGDTIRVSLAEDPVHEVPVAWHLRRLAEQGMLQGVVSEFLGRTDLVSAKAGNGSVLVPYVIVRCRRGEGYPRQPQPDFCAVEEGGRLILKDVRGRRYTVGSLHKPGAFICLTWQDSVPDRLPANLTNAPDVYWIVEGNPEWPAYQWEAWIHDLVERSLPLARTIIRVRLGGNGYYLGVALAARFARLFLSGVGGLWLESPESTATECATIAFQFLQGLRRRIESVEYIACPSCGRTQFHLEEVVAAIRARTQHLKGIKIAIMGCIVNGLGEMADADYGYVGSGPGRVHLYRGRQLVRKNVPEEEAVDALIALIKEDGRWEEPPPLTRH